MLIDLQGLGPHLEETYGIRVSNITPLEPWAPEGVQRVDRPDGARWVVRVFPRERPHELADGEAEILRFLEDNAFPSERCADGDPVSVLNGQSVLVTEYVEGTNARGDMRPATLTAMGELLGTPHTLRADHGAMSRPGGSWHLLTVGGGTRRADAEAIRASLKDVAAKLPTSEAPMLDELREMVDEIDDYPDLPQAIVHPDFCGPNVINTPDGRHVVIDWTGSGRGPRISPLGLLLRAGEADLSLVDAIVAGYGKHIRVTPEEIERLPEVVREHGLVMGCWSLAHGYTKLPDLMQGLRAERETSLAVSARARQAFGALPQG
jgi:Ser/Thr protein kinase RdoA (MazF antagonist)